MIKSKKHLGIDPNESGKHLMNESALSLANYDTAKANDAEPIELASPDRREHKSKKTGKTTKAEARPSLAVSQEPDLPIDVAQQQAWDRLVAKNNKADDLISVEQDIHDYGSSKKLVEDKPRK
jgi:hypothetical protein